MKEEAKLKIFKRVNQLIEGIILILEKEIGELNRKYPVMQSKKMKVRGEIYYKGLYVPFSTVEYKLLFEHYEIVALRNFQELYRGIYKNIENVFTEFAVRTLQEVGIDHIKILFNSQVAKEDKKRFCLLIMLSDYAFMENNGDVMYLEHFRKLLQENKTILSVSQQELFKEILEKIDKVDKDTKVRLIKKARITILREKNEILQKFKRDINLNATMHLDALTSSFSHLLHGNSFLINNLFSNRKNPYQHLLRMSSIMMTTGMNTVYEVNESLQNPSIKNTILGAQAEFESIRPELLATWSITDKFIENIRRKNIVKLNEKS